MISFLFSYFVCYAIFHNDAGLMHFPKTFVHIFTFVFGCVSTFFFFLRKCGFTLCSWFRFSLCLVFILYGLRFSFICFLSIID